MDNIDYSKYSVPELLQAKSSINPDAAKENYRNLLAEFDKRQNDINKYLDEQEDGFVLSIEKRLKALGYLQLLGAVVIFLNLGVAIVAGPSLVYVFISIVAVALNGTAGYLTVNKKSVGYTLSFINLSLQLVSINTESFLYSYNGLGGVFLGLGDGISLNAAFSPGFSIAWGANTGASYFGIDLLAIFFLFVLLNALKLNDESANK